VTAAATHRRWSLTLDLSGAPLHSIRAIETVQCLCSQDFARQVDQEVVDLHLRPLFVGLDTVIAGSTLVKRRPCPLWRLAARWPVPH